MVQIREVFIFQGVLGDTFRTQLLVLCGSPFLVQSVYTKVLLDCMSFVERFVLFWSAPSLEVPL